LKSLIFNFQLSISSAATALTLACYLCACTFAAAAEEGDKSSDPDRAAIALEALSRLKGIDLDTNPVVKTAVLNVLDQVRGTPQLVELVRDFKIKG